MLSPVDFVIIMIGLCGVWALVEIHNMLRQILYELNPRKQPIKGAKRRKV
jgi:hypothetical protein